MTSVITRSPAKAGLRNAQPLELSALPDLGVAAFRAAVIARVAAGARLVALFGSASGRLFASLADGDGISTFATLAGDRYPSLTPDCPAAHWFEREIAEQWAIVPEGHPWLKPIRFHRSAREGKDAWGRAAGDTILPGVPETFRMDGDEVHEVAVGPVHAGVIEPGHFRFQCHGERVFHLEISLGYQHRGVERALAGGPGKRTIHLIETMCGDTTVAHTIAYCELLESLCRVGVPPRAQAIRGIALELERLANHVGDLGALANDVGYLPTASWCGRIRGDFLNLTAAICGNRFGRGLVRPGGTGFDIDAERADRMTVRLRQAMEDAKGAVDLLWSSATVRDRFEGTGPVSTDTARALGLLGPAARASGLGFDARTLFPTGAFRESAPPEVIAETGDVQARALVRWQEMERSGEWLLARLASLPAGPVRERLDPLTAPLARESIATSLCEGWRGTVTHVAITDAHGKLAAYKVVDPSFRNWMGLATALRDQPISDFPLCNKSFNLSYCGHDL